MKLIIFAMILLIQPAFAGGSEPDAQTAASNFHVKKKNKIWQLPVVSVSLAAGLCWFWCADKPTPKPLPASGQIAKNDVTPDLKYGERLYQ